MRLRMRSIVLGACVALFGLLALGAAGPASAATYKGTTSQDAEFKLQTNAKDVPTKANYSWDMTCTRGGSISSGTVSSGFPRSSANGFKSRGKYSTTSGKYAIDYRVKIKGKRASETRFTGRFKLTAKVTKRRSGDRVDSCKTGIVRWRADLGGSPAPAAKPATTLRLP